MQPTEELLQQCKKGKSKAQYQLYKMFYGILMGVCIRYKKNKEDAEEILNIGFMKILSNISKYNTKVPFEAWARRIVINTVIDEFRKNKKYNEQQEKTAFENDEAYNFHIDVNEAEKTFDAEELTKMIADLPPVTSKVFNMYAIDGYAHKEIAEMLEMSVGTSKWHVSTARKALQEKVNSKLNKEVTTK